MAFQASPRPQRPTHLGDCLAYALARQHGVPLFHKGDDFSLTDLA